MLLKQRTIHAGFMYTNLFPTNSTIRSLDAPRCVCLEQQVSSGSYMLHVSSTAVALWRCLWIMVKTCVHSNCVLCTEVFKLSQWRNSIICSWADSRVKVWKLSSVSGTDSVLPVEGPTEGLEEPKLFVLVLPNLQLHTLKIGTESVPETSENFRILTLLSAQEHSIELRIVQLEINLCI
jgi:hypothetical protein